MEPPQLISRIRDAARGDMPIVAPETARCILGRLQLNAGGEPRCPGARKSTDGALTPRETEIVSLIADGATNREIGSTLMLSQNTVKNHIKHILDKLHLQNRTQVAAWATRSGFASQR